MAITRPGYCCAVIADEDGRADGRVVGEESVVSLGYSVVPNVVLEEMVRYSG